MGAGRSRHVRPARLSEHRLAVAAVWERSPLKRTRTGCPSRQPLITRKIVPRKFVDISICLENDVVSDPPGYHPKIEYIDHKATAPSFASFYPGVKASDLPEGEGFAYEQ